MKEQEKQTPPPLPLPDTPTHRLHLMQMSMQQIKQHIEQLQLRRASIVAKIEKAKSNSKFARSLQVNKQLARLINKMERNLLSIQSDLDDIADDLNKARALILEVSDGEVLIEKEPTTNGNA